MKNTFIFSLLLLTSSLMAENNTTISKDINSTVNKDENLTKKKKMTKEEIIAKQVEEQMEREKKYAKEQIFYQGDDYDLSSSEVNQKSLDSVPTIEVDLDFDMDDVYRDDL